MLEEIKAKIEEKKRSFLSDIATVNTEEELDEVRIRYMGKKGEISVFYKLIGKASAEDRPKLGKLVNDFKKLVEEKLQDVRRQIEERELSGIAQSEWIDKSLDIDFFPRGHIHPISTIQYEIEDIFTSMGFIVLDGPEIETDYFNFEALNIPKHHPARDMQDTFWLDLGDEYLLRTHTSCIQVRGMKRLKPPFRVIAPGRVFRYEQVDASHENTFYQVEGLMVDKDVSVANMLYFMKVLIKGIFRRDVEVRLRPGYFPFVEPGFELDIKCLICGGKGCPVCKHTGWVELLPCGLVHPNVLREGGIDTDIYSGFAFGLGLNRLVMMKYGINDIRYFQSGDLRFLKQF